MPPENRQNQPEAEPASAVLAQVWHQAPIGLAVLRHGSLSAWNPQARRLLEDAVGGAPTAWVRWLEAGCARLLAAPDSAHVLEARRQGGPALALTLASGGQAVGQVVVAVQAAAAGSERAAGGGLVETVSTLSHELRTPLASIRNSLSLLMAGDAGPLGPDQMRFLGVAARNVARLDRLVCDLLDLSRDDAGRLRVDCRPVDLGPVLREAVALGAGGESAGGPRLDADGIPTHFPACVDPDRITQIVANLVGNARKYVPADGRVRVWLDAHQPTLEPLAAALARACRLDVRMFTIVVEDNGPGIDPQVIDRVFEPFERGRAEVIGRIGGAGLGLHIVRRLAEAHGGKVSLASAPGAGTTIWVRLPVDAAGAQLLRAAAQLRSELGAAPGSPTGPVAVFDGRLEGAATPGQALAALSGLPTGAVGPACEPADGCLAAAVPDPQAWAADPAPGSAGWLLVAPGAPLGAEGSPGAISGKPGPAPVDIRA
ncbi:MAG: hypothetical protein IPK64_07265 [bacterium]|nr:hypothetical protein [bacterium]